METVDKLILIGTSPAPFLVRRNKNPSSSGELSGGIVIAGLYKTAMEVDSRSRGYIAPEFPL